MLNSEIDSKSLICLSSVEFCPAKLRKKAERSAGVILVGQRTLLKIGLTTANPPSPNLVCSLSLAKFLSRNDL